MGKIEEFIDGYLPDRIKQLKADINELESCLDALLATNDFENIARCKKLIGCMESEVELDERCVRRELTLPEFFALFEKMKVEKWPN